MYRVPVVTLTMVLVVAGCGESDEPDKQESIGSDVIVSGGLVQCDQLAGLPTTEVLEVGVCDNNGEPTIAGFASYDCQDGRRLSWNNFGWGFSDGDWNTHDGPELVPPDAEISVCLDV